MTRAGIVATLTVLLVAAGAPRAQSPAGDVPLLVSTAWLADHVADDDVVLLWTSQRESGPQIAGARPLPHGSLMSMARGQHDLAPMDDLVAAFERVGVSTDSHVVVYGEPTSAGWLFFALEYLGHSRVSMLDGSLDTWQAEGRAVAVPTLPSTPGRFEPVLRTDLKADAAQVQAIAASGAVLDARGPQEFDAGHIPGAALVPWQELYADPVRQIFKSREEIAALFAANGATPGTPAITYCQIGLRSSALYFGARYAGLDVRNYVGSWSDWTQRELPVERPE